ncbi:MAG: choice-of-anchor D domain-containing protein [Terriglobia bacterium]
MKPQVLWTLALLIILPSATLGDSESPAAISLSTISLTFASQAQGSVSASQSVTLTNTGGSPLKISDWFPQGDFEIASTTCKRDTPIGLKDQCVFNVTFAPTALGLRYGSLTIKDNDGGVPTSRQVVALSGTGTVAPAAPIASAAPAKPAGSPCLRVSPDWVAIPSVTPIRISFCDTPAGDLSKGTVTPLISNGEVKFSGPCKSATTSELTCDLNVTPQAERELYSVEVDDGNGKLIGNVALHVGGPNFYWLGLAGIDLTSTASGPQQQWFAGASLMGNLFRYPWTKSPQSGVWGWLDAKIGSIPTQKSSALSSVTNISSTVSSSGVQNIGDIAQTLEFRTGLSFYLRQPVALILGLGSASPINPISGAQEYSLSSTLYSQFNATPALQTTYPQLWNALGCYGSSTPAGTTCKVTTVAFVLPSRSRFYRNYFGGLRFWTKQGNGNIYPGFMDATVGQDETVTGGELRGMVLTLTGDYPVGSTGVRIFASTYMRIARNTNTVALNMDPVTSAVDPVSSSVVIQKTLPLDRDYFRVGIGVDIHQVFTKLTIKKK